MKRIDTINRKKVTNSLKKVINMRKKNLTPARK
jgi:hypothetical protein